MKIYALGTLFVQLTNVCGHLYDGRSLGGFHGKSPSDLLRRVVRLGHSDFLSDDVCFSVQCTFVHSGGDHTEIRAASAADFSLPHLAANQTMGFIRQTCGRCAGSDVYGRPVFLSVPQGD